MSVPGYCLGCLKMLMTAATFGHGFCPAAPHATCLTASILNFLQLRVSRCPIVFFFSLKCQRLLILSLREDFIRLFPCVISFTTSSTLLTQVWISNSSWSLKPRPANVDTLCLSQRNRASKSVRASIFNLESFVFWEKLGLIMSISGKVLLWVPYQGHVREEFRETWWRRHWKCLDYQHHRKHTIPEEAILDFRREHGVVSFYLNYSSPLSGMAGAVYI